MPATKDAAHCILFSAGRGIGGTFCAGIITFYGMPELNVFG